MSNYAMGTTNGTEGLYDKKYRTSDGFIFNSVAEAAFHNMYLNRGTNAGTYIEPIEYNSWETR